MTQYFATNELKQRYPMSMSVQSPADLKKLSFDELENLAKEHRDYLIEICSRNGGHLGPGLGVLELTYALHRVFDSPQDKIVWDIGHQSYPHKLVTGRFEAFQGVRKEGGVSGFCRRDESEHDIFGAGHAGTSISAAIGLGEGMRRNGDSHKTIAIIGDAALTAGLAYEGLHQDVKFKKNLIVILNDNEMSIAPNVGAINALLSQKMSSPFLHKLQDEVKSMASRIPFVGDEVVQTLSKIKHSLKNLVIPTVLFESLGFRYYGPVDGHNLEELCQLFENVRQLDEPVFIHIVTEKGRGYAPAIADKETFHGCGPYDKESGKIIKEPNAKTGYNKVYAETLTMLAKADSRVVGITAAMPSGTGLGVLQKALPNQYYDVGISEQHAVTFAGGLALEGAKPHVAIYSTFMQRAYDQVIHDICIQNLNVKFGMDRAGFVGADGATHHGNYDVSFMRAIPNLHVCAPKDERELQELVVAMDKHEGPACVRYPRGGGEGLSLYKDLEEIPELEWGTGEIVFASTLSREEQRPRQIPIEWLERSFKSQKKNVDLILVGYGTTVYPCIRVAEKLSEMGIGVVVVNARFVKPIDSKLFERLTKLSRNFITVEEQVLMGGFGSALMEFFEGADLLSGLKVKRLGIPDQFFHQANQSTLWKQSGIDDENILKTSLDLLASEKSLDSQKEVRQQSS